jgi:hypothetical protein
MAGRKFLGGKTKYRISIPHPPHLSSVRADLFVDTDVAADDDSLR